LHDTKIYVFTFTFSAKVASTKDKILGVSVGTQTSERSLNRPPLGEKRRIPGRSGIDGNMYAETSQQNGAESEDVYETLRHVRAEESKPQLVGKVSPFRRVWQEDQTAERAERLLEKDAMVPESAECAFQGMKSRHRSPAHGKSVRTGLGEVSKSVCKEDLCQYQEEIPPELPPNRRKRSLGEGITKEVIYDQPAPIPRGQIGADVVTEPPPLPVGRRDRSKDRSKDKGAKGVKSNNTGAPPLARLPSPQSRNGSRIPVSAPNHFRTNSADGSRASIAAPSLGSFRRHSFDVPTPRKDSQTVGIKQEMTPRSVGDASPEHEYLSLIPVSPVMTNTLPSGANINYINDGKSGEIYNVLSIPPRLQSVKDEADLCQHNQKTPHVGGNSNKFPNDRLSFESFSDKLFLVPKLTVPEPNKGLHICDVVDHGQDDFLDMDAVLFDDCSKCAAGLEAGGDSYQLEVSVAPDEGPKQKLNGIFDLMERVNSKWKEIEQKYGSDGIPCGKNIPTEGSNSAVENCRAFGGSDRPVGSLSAFMKVGSRPETVCLSGRNHDILKPKQVSAGNEFKSPGRTEETSGRMTFSKGGCVDVHLVSDTRLAATSLAKPGDNVEQDRFGIVPGVTSRCNVVPESSTRRRRSRNRRRRSSGHQSSQDSDFADKSELSSDEKTATSSGAKRSARSKVTRRKIVNSCSYDSGLTDVAAIARQRTRNDVETSDMSSVEGRTVRPPRRRYSEDSFTRKKNVDVSVRRVSETVTRRPDIPNLGGVGMVRSKGNSCLNRISGDEGDGKSGSHVLRRHDNKQGKTLLNFPERVGNSSELGQTDDLLGGLPARNSSVLRASYSQIKDIYEGKRRNCAVAVKCSGVETTSLVKLDVQGQSQPHEHGVTGKRPERLVRMKSLIAVCLSGWRPDLTFSDKIDITL
jgi:hypothetical protein